MSWQSRLLRWLLTIGVLLVAGSAMWLGNQLPKPNPFNAPATEFSAERAMHDVRAIATRPHPIGSPEIAQTRRYLLQRMEELGLAPRLIERTAVVTRKNSPDSAIGGRVRNILGELKGSDPALPAIMLMAHYDTAPLSPGAGDDTSGVAVALETVRALKAAGPLRRSVLLLFTDGEEAGLLGASAFFEAPALRRRVGIVINLEARGDSGRTVMFQTSEQGRALIDAYRHSVASPSANSLLVSIYKRMPNDTDLTAALNHGVPGMNFAFAGNQVAYHTPLSTPDRLNPGSLQHMGAQVLPVARHLAQARSLGGARGDMVFVDLLGRYMIAYPSWIGWALAVLAIGGAFATIGIGLKHGRIEWRGVLSGVSMCTALLFGIATMLMLVGRIVAWLLRDMASPYAVISQIDPLLVACVVIGLGTGAWLVGAASRGVRWAVPLSLAGAGIVTACLGRFDAIALALGGIAAVLAWLGGRRALSLEHWLSGAVAVVAVLGIAMQFMLPNGAHCLTWPLLLLIPVLAMLLFGPRRATRPIGLLGLAVAAAAVAVLAGAPAYGLFVLVGPQLPAILAPFIWLVVIALAPLLWPSIALRWIGIGAVVAALALAVLIGFAGRSPSAANPEMVELFDVVDADAGRAMRVGGKLDRGGWVRAMLERDGGQAVLRSLEPFVHDPLWMAPVRPKAPVRPELRIATAQAAASHEVVFTARGTNGGRYLRIFLKPSVDLKHVRFMDRPVAATVKAGEWSQFVFHAGGREPVTLIASAATTGRVDVRVAELRDGPIDVALPPHTIPFRRAGSTMITAQAAAAW